MSGSRKISSIVRKIEKHGNGVYTLVLSPDKPIPAFHPGQFLHLALDEYDPSGFWPDSRAFSIATIASDRSELTLAYSVKGKFTTRMEAELTVGRRVWIKLPYGDFVIDSSNDVVLIAGGTGITAFSAFLEGLMPGRNQVISLIYGARNENLLLFNDMLMRVAKTVPNFHIHYALESKPSNGGIYTYPIKIGQLNIEWIWEWLENPLNAVFYLSGPPPMLNRFSIELKSLQVLEKNIRIDAWE